MEASNYRRIARENLAGNWGLAIAVALIAALLGGMISASDIDFTIEIDEELYQYLPNFVLRYLLFSASVGSVLGLVHFIIGGVIRQGYCVFLLKQYDRKDPRFEDLFSQFHRFSDGFCLAFLESIFIFLWTMLFVIPGIVAAYRYAMAPFIMAENPNMTASEAINASKEMMCGHKGELFWLHLTFIGWSLLSALTLGIGSLFLRPYMAAAETAFYRDLARQRTIVV